MKNLIIALIAVFALLLLADCSQAACGGRGLFGIRARRAAGHGLFQGNGPFRRGSCGRGGC